MVVATLLWRISFCWTPIGGAGFIQQRAVRMPERMPAQLWNANLLSFGPENLLLKNYGMIRPPGDMGREYEPDGLIFQPGQQELGERRVDWDFVFGSFGFYSSDTPADDSLLNQNHARGEVDMLPAQCQDLG